MSGSSVCPTVWQWWVFFPRPVLAAELLEAGAAPRAIGFAWAGKSWPRERKAIVKYIWARTLPLCVTIDLALPSATVVRLPPGSNSIPPTWFSRGKQPSHLSSSTNFSVLLTWRCSDRVRAASWPIHHFWWENGVLFLEVNYKEFLGKKIVAQWNSVPVLKTVKFSREEQTATEGTFLVQLHCSQAFTAHLLPDVTEAWG